MALAGVAQNMDIPPRDTDIKGKSLGPTTVVSTHKKMMTKSSMGNKTLTEVFRPQDDVCN